VLTEEVVDKKILDSVILTLEDGTTLFKTARGDTRTAHFHPDRKEQTVLQLGTADDVLAVKAASRVLDYVSEININMGCPKPFSIQGGMGAALLSDPLRATTIVRSLRSALPHEIPVTCKIRYLSEDGNISSIHSIKRTTEFMTALVEAGADAITLHMRTRPMRPREPAIWDAFTDLIQALPQSVSHVPIIANGDFFTRQQINQFRESVHTSLAESFPSRKWCDSVMIARGALWNPSIFAPHPLPIEEVVADFVDACKGFNEPPVAVKWIVSQMMDNSSKNFHGEPIKFFREKIQVAKSMDDIEYAIAKPQSSRIIDKSLDTHDSTIKKLR